MNKDVFPVAELNLPSAGSGKFSWDLNPTEVAHISRKHHSDPPHFHLQLGTKNDDTVPLTSKPKIVDPINSYRRAQEFRGSHRIVLNPTAS